MSVDLQQVRYVLEVAEQLSFAKAAEALWVSRATMSEQVRQVERRLGVDLFARTTRRVELTGAGRVFVEHANRLLVDFATLQQVVKEAGTELRGTVRLGVPAGVVPQRIWQVVSAFRRDYPGVELLFVETTISELIRSIQKGELDVSVVAWPSERVPAGVATEVLEASPTGVVVAPDHELTGESGCAAGDLRAFPLVTFVEGFALRSIATDFCQRAGLDPSIALQSAVDETVAGLVRAGVGYSVLTKARAADEGLAVLDVGLPCLDRVIGLGWPSQGELTEAAALLRTRIVDTFRTAR